MKRFWVYLLIGLLCLSLCGCGGTVSSYSATMMKESRRGDRYTVEFSTLSGRYVMQCSASQAKGDLYYEAELGAGEMTLSWRYREDEKDHVLSAVRPGAPITGSGPAFHARERVYLVIETNGKAEKGKVLFEFR